MVFGKNHAVQWEALSPEEQVTRIANELKRYVLGRVMFERSRKFSPAEIAELQARVVETFRADGTLNVFGNTLTEKLAEAPRTKPAVLLKDIFGDFFWELEEKGCSYLDV